MSDKTTRSAASPEKKIHANTQNSRQISPFAATMELARISFIEARRINLVAISLWISALGSLLALSTIEATRVEQGRILIDTGLLAASTLGTITALTMTLRYFCSEDQLQSSTLHLVHPIPRYTLVTGRVLGLFGVLCTMVAVIGTTTWLLLMLIGERVPLAYYQALIALPFELLVVQTTTLLFATLASRPYAAAMSVGLFIAGNLSEDVLLWAQNPRAKGRAHLLLLLHALLPDYARLSLRHFAANAIEVPKALMSQTLVYATSYAMIALILAAISFSRRRSL